MPLSDGEIWRELETGRLQITPPPTPERVGSSSIDLLLHEEIVVLKPIEGVIVDPAKKVQIMNLLKRHGEVKNLVIAPHRFGRDEFIIAQTLERIRLPNDLAARIEGKSSLARLGLAVHQTAPTVLAGFEGTLTLEMHNVGPFEILLSPGMAIAQLIVERLGQPASRGYQEQFQGQR